MLTEQTHTEPNWKLLPGTILDGGYELEELLEADGKRARFKIRVLGDRTIEAFASLFPADGTEAQEQVEAWDLLRRIPHPNVSKPFAAGRRELDGAGIVYVVLRKPDEALSGVLQERALTGEEASEVLLSGARGLEHLDRHGLVHGSVSPEQVLAVGDSIQLSAEGVRKADRTAPKFAPLKPRYTAPESANGNVTTAAAIWCLGASVCETLTQKLCADDCREQAKGVPLSWVLERCLEPEPSKRCKPEEIPALVKSGPPPAVVTPPVVVAPASVVTASAGSVPAEDAKAAGASAGAGSAGPDAVAGVTMPASAPRQQMPTEVTPSKPILSVSQARTKAFQQAEFDVLTAPKGTAAAAKGVASAAVAASLAAPALGAAQPAAARASTAGAAKFESAAAGARQPGSASVDAMPGELGRRSGRATFTLEPEPQRSRLWMYVAGGVAVVLLLIWAMRSKPAAKTANNPAASAPVAAQNGATPAASNSSATAGKAWPTRTLEPDKTGSGASTAKSAAATLSPSSVGKADTSGAVWRVVVYTFNRGPEAEKKAHTLNAKHPKLGAQVFTPNGTSGPYLVTVGGKMTREEAARFRSRAMGFGLPRDSYIQNYKP